ncbi:hypothetical protein EN794_033595 [Mesorhizobium sp. M00.F.Ca.ET.151.01.1.1]|uniref:hypothetical protein n=1 Tax=unclassified Mesorhizobium TaxID=325217 RepID=UPI000FC9C414|nr:MULTISPECIES: hypothetical protein [unclassified Mesorhizobium]RUW96931.1 hypothetical protein EOA35_26670 [Mesorhizobium sp. M8A.F.Ca.ET.023.01.1.1]RVD47717.1 hypothetical protein EN746_26040 [Mesorhizobium sp. M8A.F.Ca.ET.023.02.2.1]TGU93378.1 hypothetical protein EN794_033595 [Mesorhizobium sp. M00.F.Ca.ET.151.01.1.1]TGV15729.1 hypothetical protein EN816_00295 [Mesorhizobium sp. M8A.F.Ca.ET.173.01.1.1]RUW43780.1 hypothetical protein EOA36_33520 [Mesorhizobium sp. M8A.F.Ca.ET.021.01.1.1]
MNLKTSLFVLGTISMLSGVGVASAQAADALRVRGTVVSFEPSLLTVKTRQGDTSAIKLKDGWKLSGVAKASVNDIKQGDFLGIASVSKADGGSGALEVVVFPAALKGTGEGDRPWDLEPNSRMTNGTVADVTDINGRAVTLTYDNGQTKKISIPDGTPVVTFAPAAAADLKPSATVFVTAQREADGTLSASRVVVGNKGVVPPM